MKVIVDPKAVKFIESKNEDSIVVWLDGCSSWGVGEPKPSVMVGKPDDIDDYDEYKVSNINVYVRCDVQTKNDELKIKYSKILWKENLVVEGMLF